MKIPGGNAPRPGPHPENSMVRKDMFPITGQEFLHAQVVIHVDHDRRGRGSVGCFGITGTAAITGDP